MKKYDSIPFLTDDGSEVEFCIIEQTRINGINYLLVAEDEEEDQDETVVYIMKESTQEEDGDMNAYEMVEDETELSSVSKIFEQLIDDMDLEVE